jgi:hypothetical protein
MKQICMRCKFFKIEDEFSGYCRELGQAVDNDNSSGRQMVKKDDSCGQWKDCGQQYYIRKGWIRARYKQGDSTPRR